MRRLDDGDGKSITKHFRPSNFFLVLSAVTVLYPRLLAFSRTQTLTSTHTRLIIAFDRLEALKDKNTSFLLNCTYVQHMVLT